MSARGADVSTVVALAASGAETYQFTPGGFLYPNTKTIRFRVKSYITFFVENFEQEVRFGMLKLLVYEGAIWPKTGLPSSDT